MMWERVNSFKKYLEPAGQVRWLRAFVALVMLSSSLLPAYVWMSEIKAYALTPETEKVIGPANSNLSAKFSFDEAGNKWQFNKNGLAALASNMAKQQGEKDIEGVAGALSHLAAKQVGGVGKQDTSLYSVDLPADAKEGITYYDNVTRLSFKMVPTFSARDGKLSHGRIIYPFKNGQVIYTAKSDGLKEDIVLSKKAADNLSYGYKLDLPETLEARVEKDGSIGVYSADPALFGDISFSNEEDKARVMEGRKNGHKEHRVFTIPAPFIKDQNGRDGRTHYSLKDDQLTVHASGLSKLAYPLSIDPSVTVTSSSDFQSGNNEGMISYGADGHVSRGNITGGTLGAWNFTDNSANRGTTQNSGSGAANGMITNRNDFSTATFNGFIYAVGGDNQGTRLNTIERAPLNANGTVGTWVSSGTLPEARSNHVTVAYNGYLYIIGGYIGGGSYSADVKFAPINASDGSLGTWTSTTSMPIGRTGHGVTVYNGMMYIINGCTTAAGNCNTASPTALVYCATLNATGQVGTWSSCNTSGLTGRDGFATVAYNGFLYGVGGCATYTTFSCTSQPTTVQYAKINSDGSLGNWVTSTTSFSGARHFVNLTVHNGHLYLTGGHASNYTNAMQYAPLHANGGVGSWRTTASYTTARSLGSLTTYNGYLYILGGCTNFSTACGVTRNDVQYTQIDPAGVTESYTTETDTIETDGIMHSATVAYNGFLYMLGGTNGPNMNTTVTTVYYTALNSDGSTGAWGTTSSFSAHRAGAAAVAYNGYMYILGGHHTTADTSCSPATSTYCSDVQKAVINSDGTLGAWSSAGGAFSTTERGYLGAAAYNGYLYAFGGVYNNNTNVSSETSVGQIQPDGSVTGWTTTGNLSTAISNFSTVQYGPYLFALGGRPSNAYTNGVQYAVLNNSGTVTWASTTAFTGARYTPSAGVYNGYVYIAGGESGAGTNNYNDTQYARICQTTDTIDGCNGTVGTLGTWRTTKNIIARGGSMGTVYNGYFYVMGGCTNWGLFGACSSSGALLNDLQYAKINNGGPGNTTAWNTQATSGSGRGNHGGATYNGYLYVAGGCSGGVGAGVMSCAGIGMQSDVRYATLANDGTTGSWASAGADFTAARFGLSSLAYNGYLYVFGGCSATTNGNCTSFHNDVQFAPINANGTIGSWSTTNSFATGRYGLSTVAHNGYMYVLGGCSAVDGSANCTGFQSDIQKALICTGSNNGVGGCGATAGTVGTWSSAGSSFTTGRLYQNAVINNGYMYVLAGCSAMASGKDCTTFQSDVQSIAINATTGALTGSWERTTSLWSARYGSSAVAYNGHLYLVGGCTAHSSSNCTAKIGNVMYAPFGANGRIGNWTTAVQKWSTDPGRFFHVAVASKGYMVLMNGIDASNGNITTQQTSFIDVQSRNGQYSKLLAVSPTTDIAGVYYNGTLGEGSSVQYKVAPSSGVFGAASSATQGSGSEPTPLCGAGAIYYVQVNVTLNDTTNAIFGDSNLSNVTDITTYYRLNAIPPPNLRLNGGKWFYSETQQALDICRQ